MFSRLLPNFTDNMGHRLLIQSLNQLVDVVKRLAGFRPPAPPLAVTPDGALYLNDLAYRRIPARLTSIQSVEIEGQPDQYRYGFVQQQYNPLTGVYVDYALGGMRGDGVLQYATELNNQQVNGPFMAAIPADPGTGPLVWLRFKGNIAGWAVYEFNNGEVPFAWVEVTDSSPSDIYLGREDTDCTIVGDLLYDSSLTSSDVGSTVIQGGSVVGTITSVDVDSNPPVATMSAEGESGTGLTIGIITATITGYAASTMLWQNSGEDAGTFQEGITCWYRGANQEAAETGRIYPAREIATDYQGVAIYSWTPGTVLADLNSSSPNSDGYYDANIVYGESLSESAAIWLIDANG